MDKDVEFTFNLFQMEWERGRDIEANAKYIATISSVLIGFILTSLSILLTQIETLILTADWLPVAIFLTVFFLAAVVFISVIMRVNSDFDEKKKTAINTLIDADRNNEKTVNETYSVKKIKGQFNYIRTLNDEKRRYLVLGFLFLVEGILLILLDLIGIVDALFGTKDCILYLVLVLNIIAIFVVFIDLLLILFRISLRKWIDKDNPSS